MDAVCEKPVLAGMGRVSLDDREKIAGLIGLSPSRSCENSFATVFAWSAAYNTSILYPGKENAFLYNPVDGILHYPLGRDVPPETLARYACAFSDAGLLRSGYVYNVPPDWGEKFPGASAFFDLSRDPADADYIYDVAKLRALTGPKLRKKRNHIKRFSADHPRFAVQKISPANTEEARLFMEDADLHMGLLDERKAVEKAFANFGELGMEGILLRAEDGGKILGCAVFSRLNSDTFTVHFEKSLHEVEGAPQMLVKLEADALAERGAAYMNREQDLGDENLRRAKNSLDPCMKYERLRAYLKPCRK